jgi:molybdenum cofactor guanylyltransferase
MHNPSPRMNPYVQHRANLTAIVLAGGKSSRMGQDKALLKVGKIPLLQQVCEIARQCARQTYVVTSWTERYLDLLPSDCSFVPERPLPGELEPSGPLVGFAQGLDQVSTDWVLLLACDLPQLQAEVLQRAIEQLEQVPKDAIAFLPKSSQGWEPLCGFYRCCCLPDLMEFIEQGGRSFQAWLARQIVAELTLTEPQILFNCNTPEDLAIARKALNAEGIS